MKMTKCKKGSVELLNSNVLLVDIASQKKIDAEDIYEMRNVALNLIGNKKLYSIINYGAYSLPTKEARELCMEDEQNPNILARAIVVNDMGQLILAKHTVKNRKTNVPTQIFKSLDEAKKWVKEVSENNVCEI